MEARGQVVITLDVDSGKLVSVKDEAGKDVKPSPDSPWAGLEQTAPSASQKQMVITMEASSGKLISVTDEAGKPAKRTRPTPHNPLVLGKIVDGVGQAVVHTRNSPLCTWYFYNGYWHQVC